MSDTESREPGDDTTQNEDASAAGSESPEEGQAAMDDAEDAVEN